MKSPENIGFDFRILWSDDDMVVLIISAWNGSFGGAAKVYVNLDEMEEGADVLSGFPRTISDQREIAFEASSRTTRAVVSECVSTAQTRPVTHSCRRRAKLIDTARQPMHCDQPRLKLRVF